MPDTCDINGQNGHSAGQRRLLLANPRGFCAGVERAIEAVEHALLKFGAPIYVRHAIVHNREVVERLERLGAVFVEDVDEIPVGANTFLSAHGSARSVIHDALERRLKVVDAICPLVAKVHGEVERWHRAGRHVLLIGHPGHPEISGTTGQVPDGNVSVISKPQDLADLDLSRETPIAFAIQTTFAARDAQAMIEAIRARFDDVASPGTSDICYATTNRQQAIEAIARNADLVLVIGDVTSSNARRLVEVAQSMDCVAHLVQNAGALPFPDIYSATTIGLTAAASTPETAVRGVCEELVRQGFEPEEVNGTIERVRFKSISLDAFQMPDHEPSLDRK